MKIGVIAAMDKEYEILKNADWSKEHEVTITKSGVGKVNAALCAARLIKEEGVDLVISTGVGGAIGDGEMMNSEEKNEEIRTGDVVVAERTAYHDVYCGEEIEYGQVMEMPLYYETDKKVMEAAENLAKEVNGLKSGKLKKGLTVTGDWFVDTVEKAKAIKEKFPEATVIDMESAAAAQACYRLGKGFASVRMVSDTPLAGNNRQQYDNFWADAPEWLADATKLIIERLK